MTGLSIHTLLIILFFLILISAFFSGSETGMMSLNRYRLRHLAQKKNRTAIRVQKLLSRIDRLLGVILIGNTFANTLAAAIVTVIALHLFGESSIPLATALLTLVILIFSEITPKTVAALYPQRFAFIVSIPLKICLWVLYPIVFCANAMSNGLLRLFGIKLGSHAVDRLSSEELRTIVKESTTRIPEQHQDILLRVFDLENMTVDDAMIPRSEVIGIELDDDWDDIFKLLVSCPHTRLPIYRDGIDNVQGIINVRDALYLLGEGRLDKERLLNLAREAYFVPEGTALSIQLLNFRKEKKHIALVVDEYGDIQGLVSIEDIIEEIVGELTSEVPSISKLIQAQDDGSYAVDGSVNLRELNRLMSWQFPIDGPKTLSGLIIEYLESIPEEQTCLLLHGYPLEVIEVKDNLVKTIKVTPAVIANDEADENSEE